MRLAYWSLVSNFTFLFLYFFYKNFEFILYFYVAVLYLLLDYFKRFSLYYYDYISIIDLSIIYMPYAVCKVICFAILEYIKLKFLYFEVLSYHHMRYHEKYWQIAEL